MRRLFIILFICFSALSPGLSAADFVWTNSAGGNWSGTNNWRSHQVPGSGDNVFLTNNGTYTVTLDNSATLANLVLGGSSGAQTLTNANQILTLNGLGTVNANGVLSLGGGSLAGTAAVTADGTFIWAGGTFSGSGLISARGGLFLPGTAAKNLNGRTLVNTATATWSGGAINLGGGGVISNAPGGTFDCEFDGHIANLSGGTLANAGLLRKTGGVAAMIVAGGIGFNNSGAVEVQSGALRLYGGGTNNGSFVVSAGAVLQLVGGVNQFNPVSSVTGAGGLSVSGGTANFLGMINLGGSNSLISGTANFSGSASISGGTLNIAGGTANFNGSGLIAPTVLNLSLGSLGGTNDLLVSGPMVWTGGNINGLGTVRAEGGLTIADDANRYFVGRTLNNTAQATWSAGVIYASGGAAISNAPGAVFDLAADVSYFDTGSRGFFNAGVLRKTSGTNTAGFGVNFTNSGTVQVQRGTLSINRYVQTAGWTLLEGGNLSTGQPLQLQGGRLAGTNRVVGSVVNNGTVRPGSSLGSMVIAGSYTQTTNGVLEIELGGTAPGTNFDQLLITGTASLNGTLAVIFTNGFTPPTNASFVFLTNASRTGTFTNLLYSPNVAGLTVDYTLTNAVLRAANVRPVIAPITDRTNNELAQLSVTVSVTDADRPAQTFTYALTNSPTGATINSSGVIRWTPTENQGPLVTNITVLVTDSGSPRLTASRAFQVVVNENNVPPVLSLPSNPNANEMALFTNNATATDADVPTNGRTFALLSGPAGFTVSPSGAMTWTPTETDGPGTNQVRIKVTDTNAFAVTNQSLSTTNSFNVIVREVNVAPVLTVPGEQTVTEHTTLTVTNTATDADVPANSFTFALAGGPTGVAVNSASGVLTWTPGESQSPSTNLIRVKVTDSNPSAVNATALNTTNSFTVIVREANTAPTLTMPPNRTIHQLTSYSNNATATDPDIPANPLTFSLVSGPAGLAVSPSGAITWTPVSAQNPSTNLIFVRVSDTNAAAASSKSLSSTNSFTLTVNEENVAPSITVPADRTIHAGVPLSLTATASDPDLPANTLTFALLSGPTGLTVNGAGQINWSSGDADAGTTNRVRVRVFDNGTPSLSATGALNIWVVARPTLLRPAVVGTNLTLTWSAIAGRSYRVEYKSSLAATNWSTLPGDVTAPANTASKTSSLGLTNGIFRIRILP